MNVIRHHYLLLAALLLVAAPASAEPLLYRIEGDGGGIWLLGSVHALRADDYPLDARIETAYSEADRVVLEIDPAELDPAHISGIALELARFKDDRTLADVFSQKEYARLGEGLANAGLSVEQLKTFEPWFLGLQLLSLNLVRHGFAVDSGVDRHFAERALADGKDTEGLETAREQLQLFDGLPMDAQKAFLLEALEDSAAFEQQMAALVSAWRRGDAAELARLADEELGREPQLRETLLDARNRRWLPQLQTYLNAQDETLVVVGALHLVGEAGLVRLLEDAGYLVDQVE